MIFRELSNAAFRFSLRRPGAEIMGGGGRSNAPPPPAGGGKSRGPAGRGLKCKMPPSEGMMPPSKCNLTLSEGTLPTSANNTPPSEGMMPPSKKKTLPPFGEVVPPLECKMPPKAVYRRCDTRRFVYTLRGLLCDVIGRLAPRAPVSQPPNDVTPYHRTTVPRVSATRC